MIIQTQAIVLRRIDFQESSCIITIFSKDQGKCGLLAKGARSLKSKFTGKLEPGNLVELIYQHKPARSIQWLTDIQVLSQRTSSGHSLSHYLVRLALADLVLRLIDDHQVNSALFDHLAGVIRWLHDTEVDPLPVFPYIMIRLTGWMGVGLQIPVGSPRDGIMERMTLNPERGSLQRDHTLHGHALSDAMYRYVHHALSGEKKSILQADLSNAEIRQLVYILDSYFSYHFDGINPRSTEILFDTFQDISL